MALGKAFIEVHADTKPFARELASELNKIIAASEKTVKVGAQRTGETLVKETAKGVDKEKGTLKKSFDNMFTDILTGGGFSKFAKGIVDTIDDGLSGLPAEVKVVLGAAIIAMVPLAVALGSAIIAGITSGLALGGGFGIGALLAGQFVEVQDAALATFDRIRNALLGNSEVLIRPFINALGMLEARLGLLGPQFAEIFDNVADTIIPITDALLGFVEEFIPGLSAGFANLNAFLAPLQIGLRLIGQAAGQFFETILSMEDAPAALYDLLIFIEDMIQLFTVLVAIGLAFYGVLRDIAEFLGVVEPYTDDISKFSNEFGIAGEEASKFGGAIDGTIAPLEGQSKAIEETNRLLAGLTSLLFETEQNEIDFVRALDGLTESVLKNGRSLDITNEAGRKNSEQLLKLAQIAITTRQTQIDLTGDVESAQVAFEKQRAEIYNLAKQMGLSESKTEELIGAMLRIPPPKPSGVTQGTIQGLQQAIALASTLANKLGGIAVQGAAAGVKAYARGDIVTSPTVGLVGEAGPEAIIPLNNPARAQQLMAESGLDRMASTSVNVYIGNEQIDTYIDDRVDQRMVFTARSLAYGGREI
jgi:hypothetical protein